MIHLPEETEALARKIAVAHGISLEDAVRQAIEERAHQVGVGHMRRRQTVDQIRAVGDVIVAMRLLDPHTPHEIMDDVNAV